MRYVLLKHVINNDFHIDFLLDCGTERLLTWQITDHIFIDRLTFDDNFFNFTESPNRINDTIYSVCRRVFDHRRRYLDFSGDLGNQRGCVEIVEYGNWELQVVCTKNLVFKTTGIRLEGHSPTARLWQFEPPIEIALASDETTPDRLMQLLPPPGGENWVVFCTRIC